MPDHDLDLARKLEEALRQAAKLRRENERLKNVMRSILNLLALAREAPPARPTIGQRGE